MIFIASITDTLLDTQIDRRYGYQQPPNPRFIQKISSYISRLPFDFKQPLPTFPTYSLLPSTFLSARRPQNAQSPSSYFPHSEPTIIHHHESGSESSDSLDPDISHLSVNNFNAQPALYNNVPFNDRKDQNPNIHHSIHPNLLAMSNHFGNSIDRRHTTNQFNLPHVIVDARGLRPHASFSTFPATSFQKSSTLFVTPIAIIEFNPRYTSRSLILSQLKYGVDNDIDRVVFASKRSDTNDFYSPLGRMDYFTLNKNLNHTSLYSPSKTKFFRHPLSTTASLTQSLHDNFKTTPELRDVVQQRKHDRDFSLRKGYRSSFLKDNDYFTTPLRQTHDTDFSLRKKHNNSFRKDTDYSPRHDNDHQSPPASARSSEACIFVNCQRMALICTSSTRQNFDNDVS